MCVVVILFVCFCCPISYFVSFIVFCPFFTLSAYLSNCFFHIHLLPSLIFSLFLCFLHSILCTFFSYICVSVYVCLTLPPYPPCAALSASLFLSLSPLFFRLLLLSITFSLCVCLSLSSLSPVPSFSYSLFFCYCCLHNSILWIFLSLSRSLSPRLPYLPSSLYCPNLHSPPNHPITCLSLSLCLVSVPLVTSLPLYVVLVSILLPTLHV